MEDLLNRFDIIHSTLSNMFANWRASLIPSEFDSFITFMTNIAIFDKCEPDPSIVLIIQGEKFTGKTTLAKQITAIFPTLRILETSETVVNQPHVICLRHKFYSEDECQNYFSMESQPLYMGNIELYINFN